MTKISLWKTLWKNLWSKFEKIAWKTPLKNPVRKTYEQILRKLLKKHLWKTMWKYLWTKKWLKSILWILYFNKSVVNEWCHSTHSLCTFFRHFSIISLMYLQKSMTEFRQRNFCTFFKKFLSLSSVIVQLISVLRHRLFSGYFLSLTFFSD